MYSCKGNEIHETEIVAIEYKHLDIIALQYNYFNPQAYFDEFGFDLNAVMRYRPKRIIGMHNHCPIDKPRPKSPRKESGSRAYSAKKRQMP